MGNKVLKRPYGNLRMASTNGRTPHEKHRICPNAARPKTSPMEGVIIPINQPDSESAELDVDANIDCCGLVIIIPVDVA